MTENPSPRVSGEPKTIDDITIGIVGSGGDGVISAGELLVSAAAHDGLYATILKSFGPQIRGGESSCRVRISREEVLSYGDRLDVLVAFNWTDFERFRAELELNRGLVVLYDEKDRTPPEEIPLDDDVEPVVVTIPFHDLAVEAAGTPLAKNILTLGVLAELFELPEEILADTVDRKFKAKGEKVMEANRKALAAGHAYVRDRLGQNPAPIRFVYEQGEPKFLMTGNEALAFGALKAGCRFYAGYPITPSSDVMEWLSAELPRFGGTMMQTEDEIAAIGMCVGASFGGTKALTSTSGPGFALMTEFLGLAAMAEIPVVIADIQRVGPSTGIPTKTEQSDFHHAIHAGPGDTPRVVLAPYDVVDCFHIGVQAFNLAEEYQTPVIVLSDQYLGQRKESVPPFDIDAWPVVERLRLNDSGEESTEIEAETVAGPSGGNGDDPYLRYQFSDGDVSPMAIPGEPKGMHTISGLEHHEFGDPTSDAVIHARMNEKRHHKLERMAGESELLAYFGVEGGTGDMGVVSWGSTSAQVREAVRTLNREGMKIRACIPQLLYPVPYRQIQRFVEDVGGRTLWIELNYQAQFYNFARGHVRLDPDRTAVYARSGGMPFTVMEIVDRIRAFLEETD
jgi:2-oxoglutarate ferredoxin oxidoreductase subunit alpha